MATHNGLPQGACGTRPTVPASYAGKWIAWAADGAHIVAHGRTLKEVAKAAAEAGETQAVFAKVPMANVRFAGLQR